jgi:arginase family enzyme
MVLRTLLGDGPECLSLKRPLRPGQVVLAGVRALEPAERDFVNRNQIRQVSPAGLPQSSALVEAVTATGADTVYIHIDLDVLDPQAFGSVGVPEPGGVTPQQLISAISALAGHFAVAGAGITEYQPTRPEDLATLRQLISAVTHAVAGVRPDDVQ